MLHICMAVSCDGDDAASIGSRANTAEVAIQIEDGDERIAQEVG